MSTSTGTTESAAAASTQTTTDGDATAGGLSADQFRRLADYGHRERVHARQVLYAPGDRTYDLYLMESATVDVVSDATAVEPERTVYTRGPGDFTGELSMLTGQTVFLTARVRKPGTVVRIPAAQLRGILAREDDIADLLVDAFTRRRRAIIESASSVMGIIGFPDCAENRALRTFAARLRLPHTSVDASTESGQHVMTMYDVTADDLPTVIVSRRVLRRATPHDVAAATGLAYEAAGHDVDLVVVGAGPAGLAAAVYAASEGLVTAVLDASGAGGQAATSSRIENYLGFPRGVSGDELTQLALVQAQKFGAQFYAPCDVLGLDLSDPDAPTVKLADGTQVRGRAAIVATGAHYRRLDVPRLDEFERLGHVRYSATELDARDCASLPVTVVGGANSAGQAALFLASRGSRVDVVVRGDGIEATMSAYLARRLEAHPMIRLWRRTQVVGLVGDGALSAVTLRGSDGTEEVAESRTLFCFIGASPDTTWLADLARDDRGFILTDARLGAAEPSRGSRSLPFQTSNRRVFAVGDVRAGSMKRVASAVGEGASAVASVHAMLAEPPR